MIDKTFAAENLEEGCLRCLHYFALFKYPLNLEEVLHFTPYPANIEMTEQALENLISRNKVFSERSFYLIEGDKEWVNERIAGNLRAEEWLKRSPKYARVIASFPFVRGIAISGSLSKGYASENPDIDYFIITAANRLWIARSLLHFFKKLTFITGHQHFYCMNYFIDTQAIALSNQNMYSAIELATLIPVYNKELFDSLLRKNSWWNNLLPNHPGPNNFRYLVSYRRKYIKPIIEFILNLLFPACFNRMLMRITDWKWRRKWKGFGYSEEDYNRAFQTEIHISKNHPDDYEKKVLKSMENRLKNE